MTDDTEWKGEVTGANPKIQDRIKVWLLACFGEKISSDKVERNYRFLEESLELVQSLGCSKIDAYKLVDYVYGRPVGVPFQEVGGVVITLAALCIASDLDMELAGETELARISDIDIINKIRAKQVTKNLAAQPEPDVVNMFRAMPSKPVPDCKGFCTLDANGMCYSNDTRCTRNKY